MSVILQFRCQYPRPTHHHWVGNWSTTHSLASIQLSPA